MNSAVKVLDKSDLAQLAVIYGKQNVIGWDWYDSVSVPNGNQNQTINFFSNTRGGQGLPVTNMEQANQLISGKQFVLESIQLDLITGAAAGAQVAGTLADFIALTHVEGTYNFKINQVEYRQGFIKDLIGGGLFGFGTPTVVNQYVTQRCIGSARVDPMLLIPTQTNFTLEFNYAAAPNPAVAVILRPKLRGQLIRLTSA